MSKIRNKLIATLAIFAMLFTSLSAVMFAGSNFAKAEGDGSAVVGVFQLQDGASAGYLGEAEDGKDYAGLRWETKINKAYYDSLTANDETLEFGTLIAPAEFEDYLNFDPNADKKIVFEDGDWYIDGITNKNGEKIYVSNIVNANATSTLFNFGDDLSGEYVMYSAIRYDELDENLIAQAKTELVAKAYVKITNGETVTYNYSEKADTVRSLRNSVAYNLAAGNFSEADAASLKKFAVAEDKTYAKLDGEVLYSVNNPDLRETTVNFGDKLAGKNAEFALNSKYFDANYDLEKGVVTLGDNFFADLKQGVYYLTAFCADGNVYYTEVLKATTISTANDLAMFRLVEEESAHVNGSNYNTNPDTIDVLNTFDGYYVLTNNIDASTMSERLYSWAHTTVGYEAGNSSVMFTKGLTGTFDGRGYAISNLTVYRGGLFGIINGTVKNVAFQNINHIIYGTRFYANSAFLAHRMTSTGVMENVAVFAPTNTVYTGIISAFTVGATFTNCYFESPYIYALSPRAVQNTNYGYPRRDTNYFGNSSNLVIVSPFIIDGAGAGYCFDMIDVTGGNGYRNDYSTGTVITVTPETRSANATLKRYQSAEDLANRYALGDNDTLAIDKKVETTKTVIDSFENYSSFTVVNGKIYWDSLSQVKLNGELLNVSELELAVGNSAEITVFNMVGEATSDFEIKSDSDAVSISNGTITAVKPGSANLSVISKGVVLAKLTVNVPKNVVDNTADTIIVDANGEEFIVPEGWIENKTTVSLNGALVEGCTVEVDGNDVSLKFPNEKDYANKEYVVTFETDATIYKYKVRYITALIRDTQEFIDIFSFGDIDVTSVTENTVLPLFDGYYMLANNLDFNGTGPVGSLTPNVGTYASPANIGAYKEIKDRMGLSGTFDGNGYTIYDLETPQGGIFGIISGSGTVKNVGFINIRSASTSSTALFAQYICATSVTFENIYLRTNAYDAKGSGTIAILSEYTLDSINLNNCYFEANLRLSHGILTSSLNATSDSPFNMDGDKDSVIVVSKQIINHRFNADQTATNYYHDANGVGSYVECRYYGTIDRKANLGASAKGKLYRYDDLSKLYAAYTEKQDDGITPTDRSNAVQEAFGMFSTNYFDVSDGKIAWKNDLTAYSILYNNNKVVDDIISVPIDGDKEITLSVKNGIDVVLENEDLTYVLDCKDGSVTLTGAVLTINKAGEATVTIKMGDKVIRVVTIDVYKPIIDRTSEGTIILDSFGEEIAGIDAVYSATVEGGTAIVTDGNVVALSFEDEKVAADKEYVVSIETETNTILYKAHYYTSYIKTPEEFVKTFSFGSDDNVAETISDLDKLPNFSGHYVLANNIDFTDKTMPNDNFTYINIEDAKRPTGVGLTGTFDGQGYIISNLVVPNGGVFGVLNGTLKNVKFDNITSNATSATGMICNLTYTAAKVDSIYLTTSTTATHYLFSYRSYSGTVVTNSLFIGELQFEADSTTIQSGVYKTYTMGMYSPNSKYVVISSKKLDHEGDARKNGSSYKITDAKAYRYLAVGMAYRYLSISEMMDVYNNGVYTYDGVEVDMSTQKGNLETLFNDWDETYFKFDTTNGLTWRTKTAE